MLLPSTRPSRPRDAVVRIRRGIPRSCPDARALAALGLPEASPARKPRRRPTSLRAGSYAHRFLQRRAQLAQPRANARFYRSERNAGAPRHLLVRKTAEEAHLDEFPLLGRQMRECRAHEIRIDVRERGLIRHFAGRLRFVELLVPVRFAAQQVKRAIARHAYQPSGKVP